MNILLLFWSVYGIACPKIINSYRYIYICIYICFVYKGARTGSLKAEEEEEEEEEEDRDAA